jgi:hypothetical protein
VGRSETRLLGQGIALRNDARKVSASLEKDIKYFMNLNLGCGDTKIEGAIGVDIRKTDATDVVHDLSVCPWPSGL